MLLYFCFVCFVSFFFVLGEEVWCFLLLFLCFFVLVCFLGEEVLCFVVAFLVLFLFVCCYFLFCFWGGGGVVAFLVCVFCCVQINYRQTFKIIIIMTTT